MKAVWYERTGAAPDVLSFGDMPTPVAGSGEVRIRLEASGVNPADAGRRAGSYRAIEFVRVIPNSDGAGTVWIVGDRAGASRGGKRRQARHRHRPLRALTVTPALPLHHRPRTARTRPVHPPGSRPARALQEGSARYAGCPRAPLPPRGGARPTLRSRRRRARGASARPDRPAPLRSAR